ncbi:MAG TPA: hypothetical protein VFE47_02010 [Tepidisphaeraceae bacterium]|nr:hypothetical protein [Tepidisphaeraceae bacterium]
MTFQPLDADHAAQVHDSQARFEQERRGVVRFLAWAAMVLGLLCVAGSVLSMYWAYARYMNSMQYAGTFGYRPSPEQSKGELVGELVFLGWGVLSILASAFLFFGSALGRWLILILGLAFIAYRIWCVAPYYVTGSFSARMHEPMPLDSMLLSITFPILCVVGFLATAARRGK